MPAMLLNFINGKEVGPATGQVSSELDVVHAVRAAHAAVEAWAKRPAPERAAAVESFAAGLSDHAEGLAHAEVTDAALSPAVARADVDAALADVRARVAAVGDDAPVGVVGLIGARAAGVRTVLPHLGALLAAGNAVLFKPSSRATAVAAVIARALAESEIPAGVCNIVVGPGPVVGKFMVEHPGVPALLFFGRSATGRLVMAAASAQLKRLAMGLGAKNAALVLKDADLDLAIPHLIRGAFQRAGIDPLGLSKILVARELEDELLSRLRTAAAGAFALPTDADVARFNDAVALARRENGRVTGGEVDGRSVTPAVVHDLTHCSEIHQDELLVPLITVNAVKYAHEAVKWANTSPYGRAAAVFTRNVDLGLKLAGQLDVGTVWINQWGDHAPGPARKTSGVGDPDAIGRVGRIVLR